MPDVNIPRNKGGRPRTAQCGTTSGYTAHYYRGEAPCEACKDAHRAYRRQWRARKRTAK